MNLKHTVLIIAASIGTATAAEPKEAHPIHHRVAKIDGLDIFYREAGSAIAPGILLLHGFPTSSSMFRNLIPVLAKTHPVIAPARDKFDYTFRNYTEILDQFSTSSDWKERSEENAAPLRKFLALDVTKWQYTHGMPNPTLRSPDTWMLDQVGLDRPGNNEIPRDVFYNYRTNVTIHFSGRGRGTVPARSAEGGDSSVRCGPFCFRN